MCFAVPARVVGIGPGTATIERGGERLEVSLHLLDDPVAVGDYLSVQAQRYAVARLSAAEAADVMALLEHISAALDAPTETLQ